ncbi:MAG: amidohydrolase family protein [Propionibacteriaceae bacterium]|nr:amidohydrolase family protein [Propionibacteriaceae bacterium]
MTTTLIHAKRVLLPDQPDLVTGWVETTDGRITAVGTGAATRTPDIEWDGVLSPGFVDIHSHGGGGASFGEGVAATRTVLATHRTHGTTTMIGSLVTQSIAELEAQITALTPLVSAGELAGIHLEGPWLAPEYHGAHPVARLIDPTSDDIQRLLAAGSHGAVKLVTLAPERAGGIQAVTYLAQRGVTVALGHTGCDYDTARAAIAAGATGATHLGNAMPELLHRAPGPVLALWEHPAVWVELIFDGVHVAPQLLSQVMRTKPERCVLITDAMAAAGVADGSYSLGELPVTVTAGVARIAGSDTIAGSTLTLDRAIRTAVAAGVPLALALRAATAHPAAYLSLEGVGSLAIGNRADIVLLDDALNVCRVLTASVSS